MSPQELAQRCVDSVNNGGSFITLIKSKTMPKGFPKGELLSDAGRGAVYSYDAKKILGWMIKNGLIELKEEKS